MRNRRRMTIRPSKPMCIFSGCVGVVFVLIGLFVAIPSAGLFGFFWTLIALGITVYYFYLAFGGKGVGPEISIEDDDPLSPTPKTGDGADTEARLKELQRLYDQRLITAEEYEAKREEILKDI